MPLELDEDGWPILDDKDDWDEWWEDTCANCPSRNCAGCVHL